MTAYYKLSLSVSAIAVLIAAVALVGWMTNSQTLIRVAAELPAMKPYGATCVLLLSLALWTRREPLQRRLASNCLATMAGLLSLIAMFECFTGVQLEPASDR